MKNFLFFIPLLSINWYLPALPPPAGHALFFDNFTKNNGWITGKESMQILKEGDLSFVRLVSDNQKEGKVYTIEIPAELLSSRMIMVSLCVRYKNVMTDNNNGGAKFWLMLESENNEKQFLAMRKTGSSDWILFQTEPFQTARVIKAVLYIGMQWAAGSADYAWIAIHDPQYKAQFMDLYKSAGVSSNSAEKKKQADDKAVSIPAKPDNPYLPLELIDDFNETIGSRWGLGGAPINFQTKGEYLRGVIRQAADAERGSVGEVFFPAARGFVERELNQNIRNPERVGGFSLWSKYVSGSESATLSVYSSVTKHHYRLAIPLQKNWTRHLFTLDDFICLQDNSDKLQAKNIRSLQFVARTEEVRFLIDDLTAVANNNAAGKAVFISRPLWADWAFASGERIVLSYNLASAENEKMIIIAELTDHMQNSASLQFNFNNQIQTNIIKIPLGTRSPGFYTVNVKIFIDSVQQDTLEDHFIVSGDNKTISTPIGVNIDPDTVSYTVFKNLVSAGISRVRVWNFTWDETATYPGETGYRGP
ncbi:MAG TPA: hypothetical protein DC049_06845, partial [Spirochaetia bacterium]|nr:hypothetical protein [Spirochaetia bacterium]